MWTVWVNWGVLGMRRESVCRGVRVWSVAVCWVLGCGVH